MQLISTQTLSFSCLSHAIQGAEQKRFSLCSSELKSYQRERTTKKKLAAVWKELQQVRIQDAMVAQGEEVSTGGGGEEGRCCMGTLGDSDETSLKGDSKLALYFIVFWI